MILEKYRFAVGQQFTLSNGGDVRVKVLVHPASWKVQLKRGSSGKSHQLSFAIAPSVDILMDKLLSEFGDAAWKVVRISSGLSAVQ